jgi:hypothetical protein
MIGRTQGDSAAVGHLDARGWSPMWFMMAIAAAQRALQVRSFR